MVVDPKRFPKLREYTKTSDESDEYNCFAHACGFADRWIWPGRHWPRGFRTITTVATFQAIFATYGYQPCDDGALDPEYEKIAVYARGTETKHAAKQLESGHWTSKLGTGEDITHQDLASLEGPEYGNVVMFLRRRRRTPKPKNAGGMA